MTWCYIWNKNVDSTENNLEAKCSRAEKVELTIALALGFLLAWLSVT